MRVLSKVNLSSRRAGLLATVSLCGAMLAGCAESSRLADPFSNPFETSARVSDPTPTASTAPRENYSAPLGRVQSRPLSAPGASASYATPSTPSPQMAAASSVSAPASTGGIIRSTGPGGWTSQGGPTVTVGQGETATVLANRYGVPADALLRVNGYSSASQVTPGTRLTIPVYTASAAAAAAPVAARAVEDKAQKTADSAKMKFVKGPDAASKAKAAVKPAVSDDDEDEKPAAKPAKGKLADAKKAETKKPEAKIADVKKADAKKADAKTADAKKPETKKVEAPAKQPQKTAKVEAKPEAEAKKVDPAPTASLPPAESKTAAASDAANPEFRWPARGRIIQGFKAGGNDGINIAVPEGTSVKAAEGGVVAYAGSELKGYGNLVLIRHPNGFVSAYAHNGEIDVKRGDQVKRGQTIAKSGQSGNVASPQLHFELRKGSTPVDPTSYLAGL